MIQNEVIIKRAKALINEITADFDHYQHQVHLNKGSDNVRLSLSMARISVNEMLFMTTFLATIGELPELVTEKNDHFNISRSMKQNELAKFSRFVKTTGDYYQTLLEMKDMQTFLTNKNAMDSTEISKSLLVDDLLDHAQDKQKCSGF